MYDQQTLVFKPEPDSTTHGILCICWTDNDNEHPIRKRTYWPASTRTSLTNACDWFPELEKGPIPIYPRFQSGCYYYKRGIIEREIRIIGGGTAQAIYNDEERIPQPKVRKGIETRYYNGRWEKYLKSEGWVIA